MSISCLLGLGRLLDLDGGQGKGLAEALVHGLPLCDVADLVPGEDADPRLDVIVQAQADFGGLGQLAGRVGDLVLGALVLELEDSTVFFLLHVSVRITY